MTEYKVVGPHKVHGHQTGETFEATFTPEFEQWYVTAGHLKRMSKPERLACPHCSEHGNAKEKKATYADLLALRDHYSKAHPGLAAPTE